MEVWTHNLHTVEVDVFMATVWTWLSPFSCPQTLGLFSELHEPNCAKFLQDIGQ